MDSGNRKTTRPPFGDHREGRERDSRDKADSPRKSGAPPVRRTSPPDQTNAENFYYVKQMQAKTPMVIVLEDGEVIRGVIEWYDKGCLKVNRDGDPNVLLYKSCIKYMYKDEESR